MVVRGIIPTPEWFEGRIWLKGIWHVLKDIGIQYENEVTIAQATLLVLPDGEAKTQTLSNLRKQFYPDEVSPFEALIKKYKELMPHASGEEMIIRVAAEEER